ncbi:MAG: sel1 repeat family protein, partial [Gammaproteobacteria bacterium]|nr:sel1 repeat family protein [Gammaproteobacteria bacterium]
MTKPGPVAALCLALALTPAFGAPTLEDARAAVRVRDYATAARVYGELCDQGNAEACYQLGVLRTAGNGVARDPVAAASLMKKAAEAGEARAWPAWGQMLEEGLGVAADPAAARD